MAKRSSKTETKGRRKEALSRAQEIRESIEDALEGIEHSTKALQPNGSTRLAATCLMISIEHLVHAAALLCAPLSDDGY